MPYLIGLLKQNILDSQSKSWYTVHPWQAQEIIYSSMHTIQ